MSGALTADRIGQAAHHDPQLRTPERPRLRRGVAVDELDGQVAVTGIPKRQLFRGALATSLLPGLVPLLDGTRDHAALAADLGVDAETVFRVLSLLWASGVVEDAPPPGAPVPEVDDAFADFLSRMGDATGANATWEQAAGRWTSHRIRVVGSPVEARLLADELEDGADVSAGTGLDGPADLVVLVSTGADPDVTHPAVAAAWERGIPLVRLRLSAGRALVGPYVDPALTPCLVCLVAAETRDVEDPRPVPEADRDLAVALLAREVVAVVTRATPSPLPARWRDVDLDAVRGVELTGAPRAGCPACTAVAVDAAVVPQEATLPVRYEASVAMPPKQFADAKAHQMHYKPSNLQLQQRFRSWPGSPRVDLPAADLDRLATSHAPAARVTPADLALLLTTTAGIREVTRDQVLRWTAAGGNIGSVVAHVVVRDCGDLPPGVHAWLPDRGGLADLGVPASAVPGTAPVTLVLTGDYLKVAQKYGAFGLRIVMLDSGCAQATADRTARTLGLRAERRHTWDDAAVGAAVGADPDTEPVTAVIDLHPVDPEVLR